MGGLLYDSAVKLGARVDGIGLWTELSFKKYIYILLLTFLVPRQQWKDEKNGLEKQITDLEKKLKGNEENLRKREKEYKKVWKAEWCLVYKFSLFVVAFVCDS